MNPLTKMAFGLLGRLHGLNDRLIRANREPAVLRLHRRDLISACLELLGVALADRDQARVGVRLVDGDELGAEAESDDGNVEFAAHANDWTGMM